jgi:hypothetical protein
MPKVRIFTGWALFIAGLVLLALDKEVGVFGVCLGVLELIVLEKR